jgi:hypothetical protein
MNHAKANASTTNGITTNNSLRLKNIHTDNADTISPRKADRQNKKASKAIMAMELNIHKLRQNKDLYLVPYTEKGRIIRNILAHKLRFDIRPTHSFAVSPPVPDEYHTKYSTIP